MEYANKDWLEKINKFNTRIIMPFTVLVFIFSISNLTKVINLETIENLLAIYLLLSVAVNILLNKKIGIINWIKSNKFILLYIVIRCLSIVQSGFDYSAIRSVFFEVFLLVGICNVTACPKQKDLYVGLILVVEILLAIGSLILYKGYALLYSENNALLFNIYDKWTYYIEYPTSGLFSNSNYAGMLAGLAILCAFYFITRYKSLTVWIILAVSIVLNGYFLIIQGCRSAELSMIAIICILILNFIFKNKFNKIGTNKIAAVFLLVCCLMMIGIYGILQKNISDNQYLLSESEYRVDSLSSGRYSIWKTVIIESNEKKLLGVGSIGISQEERKKEITPENGYYYNMYKYADYKPHNGYFSMLISTGILGTILFFMVLFQKIYKCDGLNKNYSYLFIIFILCLNFFEDAFITYRAFNSFALMLMLTIFTSNSENTKEDMSVSEEYYVEKN